jgi:hypothetical protein
VYYRVHPEVLARLSAVLQSDMSATVEAPV